MVFDYYSYDNFGASWSAIDKIFHTIDEILNYKPKDDWMDTVEVLDLNSGEWLEFGIEDIYAGYWLKVNIKLKKPTIT